HRLLFMHFHHQGVKPDWQWRLIYKTAMRIFDRIAFCADYIRAEAEELYPPLRAVSLTRPDSYRLPTVPSHQERMAARAALGLAEDTAVVGNAGWLIQRKRWDVFLRTAAKIAQQRKDAVFLACGDGPLRDELKDQSRALGLEDRVRWLGWRQDLTPFFLSLDVLLFNSDWDALPRTPLEAGSYEIPTVASALHGGLKEFISDNSIGYLTDQHDEEWLADRTLRLLNDTVLRKMMGKACREVLAERHDPTRNAIETLRLLGLHPPSNQNTLPDYDACRLARQ
ncbi:MAG: glycosyltransferase family 4 protein, partial [Terriglobia bacterium]|nr:glycosyltransferase family 4 protein [Terriglobia bacterium]